MVARWSDPDPPSPTMLTEANRVPSDLKSRSPTAAKPRPVLPTKVARPVFGSTVYRLGPPPPWPAYMTPVVGSTASAGTTPADMNPTTVPAPVLWSIVMRFPPLASVPKRVPVPGPEEAGEASVATAAATTNAKMKRFTAYLLPKCPGFEARKRACDQLRDSLNLARSRSGRPYRGAYRITPQPARVGVASQRRPSARTRSIRRVRPPHALTV